MDTTEAQSATDEQPTETTDQTTPSADASPRTPDPDTSGAESLGDAGKKALDAMKAKWHEERAKRQDLERQMAEQPDQSEAMQRVDRRYLRSEIKAAAKGKLADPADAFRFLDLDEFQVSEDGVDESAIAEAIDKLVASKPYLGVAQRDFVEGSADGGARKASGPRQLTRADLAGMTPQQIDDARTAGQLADLMSGKA